MVVASLNDFGTYLSLHPLFDRVDRELIVGDFNNMGERNPIEGDNLYSTTSFNRGRLSTEAKLEAHNKYIDIHVCLQGEETIGWQHRDKCTQPAGEYDPEHDIIFFNDEPDQYIKLKPNTFAIFYPTDCHAPLIGDGLIKKVVFKIKL